VILACAASGGIHGALTRAHFDEGTGAGVGFLVSTALLSGLAAAMLLRPHSRIAVALAAAVLTGLLVAYGLAVTAGVPLLHPETEHVESLAVATKLGAALRRRGVDVVYTRTSDTLILHGRRICKPKPLCDKCGVRDECLYYRKVVSRQKPKGKRP